MLSEFEEALNDLHRAIILLGSDSPRGTRTKVDEARARVVALYEAAVKDAERGRWFVKSLQGRSPHMDGSFEWHMQSWARSFKRAASREEAVDRAIAEEKAWRESPDNPYRESSS